MRVLRFIGEAVVCPWLDLFVRLLYIDRLKIQEPLSNVSAHLRGTKHLTGAYMSPKQKRSAAK
jgi:hypothetical protein